MIASALTFWIAAGIVSMILLLAAVLLCLDHVAAPWCAAIACAAITTAVVSALWEHSTGAATWTAILDQTIPVAAWTVVFLLAVLLVFRGLV